jgi:hypothetical protein
MNRYILICFFLFMAKINVAQIGVKVFNYRPTGALGFVFKPTYSAEVCYIQPFEEDERWRMAATATFLVLKPRMQSFPTTTLESGGNGDRILPGAESFSKYNILQGFYGFDYSIVNKDPFYFFCGADVTVGLTTVEYTENIEELIESDYTGGGFLVGLRFRIGAEYNINKNFSATIHAERCGWVVSEPRAFCAANMYGLGIIYKFD